MEIQQSYLLNGFGKSKLTADEDKVTYEFKSLVSENKHEYTYDEIDPKFIEGKSSNGGWSNVGWFFILVAFFVSLVDKASNNHFLLKFICLPALVLGILSFCMLLVKREYISFYMKNSERFAFAILNPSKQENKAFLDFVKSKLKIT